VESGENDSLEHALHIENPTKSWAIYDELGHDGGAKYYELELKKGERLKVSIFTPEEGDFSPGIVIMGPNFSNTTAIPDFIEVPEGYGTIMIAGERSEHAEYEPFTPSSSYHTAEFDEEVNQSAKYYIAVFDPDHGGKFGVAVGYIESFSVEEWLLIPFDVINIHLWEGQNIVMILAPLVIVFVTGKIILFYRRLKQNKPPHKFHEWLGSIGGLLYMGTGSMMILQMGIALSRSGPTAAATVTLIFAGIPIVLGALLLWGSARDIKDTKDKTKLTTENRIKLFIYGILGLVFWAGLIVGPIIVMVASILPEKKKKGKK
jgi:hypothetical protein